MYNIYLYSLWPIKGTETLFFSNLMPGTAVSFLRAINTVWTPL